LRFAGRAAFTTNPALVSHAANDEKPRRFAAVVLVVAEESALRAECYGAGRGSCTREPAILRDLVDHIADASRLNNSPVDLFVPDPGLVIGSTDFKASKISTREGVVWRVCCDRFIDISWVVSALRLRASNILGAVSCESVAPLVDVIDQHINTVVLIIHRILNCWHVRD
jgi:hypothetical protein